MKKIITALIMTSLLSTAAYAAPSLTPEVPSPSPAAAETPITSPTASPDDASASEPMASPLVSPAAETTAPTSSTVVMTKEMSDKFILDMYIQPQKYVIPNDAVIELYDMDGTLLGSASNHVDANTKSVNMTFDTPAYKMGEKFKIKLVSGLRSIKYYDKWVEAGGELEVVTYGYMDENGAYKQNNGCSISGNPHYEKELCMYVSGRQIFPSPRARIVDGTAMIPVRAIGEAMGLKVKYDKNYDSVVCSVDGKEVIFNANSAYTTIFGSDTYAPHATIYLDGSLFVPVRTLAEAFGSSLEVLDFGDHLDVIIGESPIVKEYMNRTPVNRNGIGSRTNYLVWVSKSEYKVRVYQGSQYHWEELRSFPCAIGAWDTPTITGQFEYIERTQWNYPGYYVGPVLRFHNGYALHSTLLYYGGGEYDGRVGVNISHGCIRLHPQDINWIADTIPFRTRIYITE